MPTAALPQETKLTLRSNPHSYIHLRVTTLPSSSNRQQQTFSLDQITVRHYLTRALTTSFGDTGAAVSIDILKVEVLDAWVRVQREDEGAVVAALSQWSSERGGVDGGPVGLRVMGRGTWLGGLGREGDGVKDKLWSLER